MMSALLWSFHAKTASLSPSTSPVGKSDSAIRSLAYSPGVWMASWTAPSCARRSRFSGAERGAGRGVVFVAGARDDRIDLLAGPVREMGGGVIDLRQRRHFFPVVGPFEGHRCVAASGGDGFCAIFPALRADVFGRQDAPGSKRSLPENSRAGRIAGDQLAASSSPVRRACSSDHPSWTAFQSRLLRGSRRLAAWPTGPHADAPDPTALPR